MTEHQVLRKMRRSDEQRLYLPLSFASPTGSPIQVGSYPGPLAIVDLNRDGWPDLVCLGQLSVTVLLADGHGNYSPAPGSPFPTDNYTERGAVVDFNLDGMPDIAVTSRSTGNVRIFLRDGMGRFKEAACSPIGGFGDSSSLAAADFNSDGKPDFAVTSATLDAVAIYLGSPLLSADGTSCSDGNSCTVDDACGGGRCNPGATLVCDDSNPCTDDSCNTASGCVHSNSSNRCDDANACTIGDTCGGGVCSGTPVLGPPEVDSGVRVSRIGTDASVTWNIASGATTSSLLRGLLNSLPVGSSPEDETCLASRVSVPTAAATDTDVLLPGSGFWYLVRVENACGTGGYGYQVQNGLPTLPEISSGCP